MKFLKLELKGNGYTDKTLNLVEIETGELVAILEVSSLDVNEEKLYGMVSHLIRYLYNEDFALVFDLKEKEVK